jgi:hypothetical protein
MKKKWTWMIVGVFMGLLVAALAFAGLVQAAPLLAPVGTAFTYQGYITDTGSPANGSYNIAFKLYNDASGGTQVGSTVTKNAVTVSDGYFTVELDFGDVFDGTALWLEIEVQGPGDPGFTALSPRQPLRPTPYAINADKVDGLDSSAFATAAHAHDADYVNTTGDTMTGTLTLAGDPSANLDAATKQYVDALETRIADLESDMADLQTMLASVSTENGGQDFVFTGVNVHVRSGSGATYGTINGLGNLIVGYNEARATGSDKTGSHNLVVGRSHNYTSYSGLVAGYSNTVSGTYASVSGGNNNLASGNQSSVSGGYLNTASGDYSSVSSGQNNESSGSRSSVSGGRNNVASGEYSSVSGGIWNTASRGYSSVSGGSSNTASCGYSSVSGGQSNVASGTYSSVSGGRNNVARPAQCWQVKIILLAKIMLQ